MVYRTLGRTGFSVGEIGLGCEHLENKPYEIVKEVVDEALLLGVNFWDLFMSEPQVRTNIGRALAGRRQEVLIQGHVGACWKNGQYARSRDVGECAEAFTDLLTRLQTDYIDVGMIHYVDTQEDFDSAFSGPFIAYVKELRQKGVIRSIGLSSHSAEIALQAVNTGLIDVLMLSVNPVFDLLPDNIDLDTQFEDGTLSSHAPHTLNATRTALYQACEKNGVGISVMKALMAGRLLDAKASPLGVALTLPQCIHFALTRPAVSSVLVGCVDADQMRQAVAYSDMSDAEKDFSRALSGLSHYHAKGACVYCNHCLPCPVNIDIAEVNRCLDTAMALSPLPSSVLARYGCMKTYAGECITCGQCELNCPFGVDIIEKMNRAALLFGR